MKLPIIKHLARENEAQELEHTISVLESYSEHRSVKDEEMDVIGELISNLCGAVEVKHSIDGGTPEKDACNNFMQKVVGSIDK